MATPPRPRIAHRLPAGQDLGALLPARRLRRLILLATDVAMLVLAVVANAVGARGSDVDSGPAPWVVLFCLGTLAALAMRGGYAFRLRTSPFDHVGKVLAATSIAATSIVTARVILAPRTDLAPEVIRLWAFATVYLAAGRAALHLTRPRAQRGQLNTLIVGAGTIGQLIARRLGDRPELGLRPVGFLDKNPRAVKPDPDGRAPLPVLGASWDLEDVVRERDVHHVIVTFSTAPTEVMLSLVRRCRQLGIEISLVPRMFEEVSNRVSVEHLGGVALLRVEQADPRGWQFDVKYALDRLVAAVFLLLLSPVLLAVTLAVRLGSPGPIFFRQSRIGLDGSEFDILKFRTMKVAPPGVENDAAWMARALGGQPDPGEAPATPIEDRRTPMGSFLRRWSLDELPQLINVLKGDMSLVGPRPERTGYVRAFEHHVYRYGDRHRVKSGLTGWAQVNGLRGETSLDERVEYDNYYVENWTPWLDVKILLMTPLAVLEGHGAA